MGAAIINKFMDMIGMGNQDDEYENDDVEMEYDNDVPIDVVRPFDRESSGVSVQNIDSCQRHDFGK